MVLTSSSTLPILHESHSQIQSKDGWFSNALQSAEIALEQGKPISRDLAYRLVVECTKYHHNIQLIRRIQSLIVQGGLHSISPLANHLIRGFGSCDSVVEANAAFCEVSKPDQYTWNAIIDVHARLDMAHNALDLYYRLGYGGRQPDRFSALSTLKACINLADVQLGRSVHQHILENELQFDVVVGNTLVDMYAKLGNLEEARKVLDALPNDDIVSWNALITGYSQHGDLEEARRIFNQLPNRDLVSWNAMIAGYAQHDALSALQCFAQMQQEDVKPSKITFLGILKACGNIGAVELGRTIHEQIIDINLEVDVAVANTLVDTYAKCGSLEEAQRLFDRLTSPNLVSWDVMIAGYAHHGKGYIAIQYFERMQDQGITPDKFTFSSTLKACGSVASIEQARYVHEHLIKSGLQHDLVLGNTLVDMYVKCGGIEEACKAFNRLSNQNVVSWNLIITAYINHGDSHLALQFFDKMQQEGMEPGKVTFLNILCACGSAYAEEKGKQIHEHVIERGFHLDIVVGSALMDMYNDFGNLDEAQRIFDKLQDRDIVVYNAMIAGYVQHGYDDLALECFENLQSEGMVPDKYTFSGILISYGNVGDAGQGKCIHEQIVERGLQSESVVWNAVIDMYAKSGNLEQAQGTFNIMLNKNLESWNTMITGYAVFGQPLSALQCFEDMQMSSIAPNNVAFSGVLSAFSRAGLADEGLYYLRTMEESNGLKMNLSHVTCIVDLLGSAGRFNEAEDILKGMLQPDICLWLTLLVACKMHCNMDLGTKCFNEIIILDPSCAAAHVLMSNIYASLGNELEYFIDEKG